MMMAFARRLALGLLVAFAFWAVFFAQEPMIYQAVSGDRSVLVNRNDNSAETAVFLERLRRRAALFVRKALELYPDDPRVRRLADNWSGEFNETEDDSNSIAYSVSKSDVRVCVRDRAGRLADENSAMFVVLHELAHVATDEVGHTEQFWKNFRFLLELAEHVGVYNYQDHDKASASVCDRTLGSNPMSCVKKGSCQSTL